MKAQKEKISVRQLILLFIMVTFSPSIRVFPSVTASIAEQVGWLSPLMAATGLIVLVFIVQSLFKKGKDLNLSDIIYKIAGNFIGRIVVFIYFLWILILLALYVRYYTERILASIFPSTSMQFFIIIMLALVFYVIRGGLVPLARYSELIFILFIPGLSTIILLAFTKFKMTNILPVSFKDILPIATGSYNILGIWGYFLFLFFFADKVSDKEHIKKHGIKSALFVTIIAILIIAITIGVLGADLTSRMTLPFFAVVKTISLFNVIERLESALLSIWIIADFFIISVFAYIAISIVKSLFRTIGTKSFASPIILLTYTLSQYLAVNRFELEKFSNHFALQLNILLEFIVPLIIFVIGKIRKVI